MFRLSKSLNVFLALSIAANTTALSVRTIASDETQSVRLSPPVGQNAYHDDTTVLVSTTPSISNPLIANVSAAGAILPSPNVTSSRPVAAGTPQYSCNGAAYGRNLDLRSCLGALDSMNGFELPQTFGQRGEATVWDINLPFRFLSEFRATEDGKCAIDITLKPGEPFDTGMPSNLKLNAQALIDICVRVTPNEGGIVTNLGQNGALGVRVTPYHPNVRCDRRGTAPPLVTCRKILDLMPADGVQRHYGPSSDPESQVRLPKIFSTAEQRCALVIDTISSTDISDWYRLWAAAMAVENICVEGKHAGGLAFGLGKGKHRQLVLEIRDRPQRPDPLVLVSAANLTASDTTS